MFRLTELNVCMCIWEESIDAELFCKYGNLITKCKRQMKMSKILSSSKSEI